MLEEYQSEGKNHSSLAGPLAVPNEQVPTKSSLQKWPTTLGKRTPKLRNLNGSNLALKLKRSQQTATIAKVLDGMKHHLPTIQEILDKVWGKYPEKRRLDLKVLGRAAPFCDGIGVPRTNLTSTDCQVRNLFQ